MKDEFFACACGHDEHTIRFSYDAKYNELYVSVFLGHDGTGFFGRLWKAVKYTLGYKSQYGHFTNTLIKPEDCERLAAFVRKGAPAKAE
jgi:hypothetical protein